MIGQRVVHARYGDGVVQASRFGGFELSVAFESGSTRWVRLDDLRILGPVKRGSAPVASSPLPSDQHFKSRRMIEAFRLGIVPEDCIDDFTFGRDLETARLLEWLRSPAEPSLLLVGEYGTGKSHLLHYTYWRALQEGFAVAYADIDPAEAPFGKPKRIYSRLVQTLKYLPKGRGPAKGFRDFVQTMVGQGSFGNHEYFRWIPSAGADEKLWAWIEAREAAVRPWCAYRQWPYSYLPGMYDYSTAANVYCYLLSTLGWAAVNVLGLRGLVLLFDEAEAIAVAQTSYQDYMNLLFLQALLLTARNEKRLLKPGKDCGRCYCRYAADIPFLYKVPSGLKLLFAFTSLDWNRLWYYADGELESWSRIPELESEPKLELGPLPDAALKDAFEHICLLYDSAYDFLEEDLTISHIFSRITSKAGRTRLFVKGAVEALDLVRLNHGDSLHEVL